MNMIAWVGIGSLLGAFASAALGVTSARDVLLNMVVGSTGALFGGWIVSSRMQIPVFPQDPFTLWGTILMLGFTVLLLIGFNVILRSMRVPALPTQVSRTVIHLPHDRP
jgi:uncharacterized membrane protein YeaQ/YmgE (transglycosylase-associated protein family)